MNGFVTLVIVALAIMGIAIGRLPWFRMDRAAIAFAAAVAIVAAGGIEFTEALLAIDTGTIVLLFSMMVIIAGLKLAGFFQFVANLVLSAARTPNSLLAAIVVSSGVLSAIFLNDTICIMLTPLVAEITLFSRRNPVPYLIGVAVSANVGSCATLIGNPQNMLIGRMSGIDFSEFLLRLAIPSILGLAICWLCIMLAFPQEFRRGAKLPLHTLIQPKTYRPLLYKSLIAGIGMIVLLFFKAPAPLAAAAAAALILATRRVRSERLLAQVDFSLLVFFSGLFVLTAAVERTDAFRTFLASAGPTVAASPSFFAIVTVAVSNLISNVPAVLALKSFAVGASDPETTWTLLAMASTYAGNLTLVGSVANLIVAESAQRAGVTIRFGTYLRAGLPITIITTTIGVAWLTLIG